MGFSKGHFQLVARSLIDSPLAPPSTHSQLHRLAPSPFINLFPGPSQTRFFILRRLSTLFIPSSLTRPRVVCRRPAWCLIYRSSINLDYRSRTLRIGSSFSPCPFVRLAAYFLSDLSASKYSNLDNTPSSQLLRRLHQQSSNPLSTCSSFSPFPFVRPAAYFVSDLSVTKYWLLRRLALDSLPGPSLIHSQLRQLALDLFLPSNPSPRCLSTTFLVSDLSAIN